MAVIVIVPAPESTTILWILLLFDKAMASLRLIFTWFVGVIGVQADNKARAAISMPVRYNKNSLERISSSPHYSRSLLFRRIFFRI